MTTSTSETRVQLTLQPTSHAADEGLFHASARVRTGLQYANDFRAVRAFEAGIVQVQHMPIEVHLQLASTCNLDCIMCSEHLGRNPGANTRKLRYLPDQVFERLVTEVFPHSTRLMIGVGGEPMLSPAFFDIVRLAKEHDQEIHLTTNGSRIHTDEAARTLATSMARVEVSIDGATAETYERIRQGASFAKLMANLDRLNRFRLAVTAEERCELALCMVLMRSNLHELVTMIELAASKHVDRVAAWHVIPVTAEGKAESLLDEPERTDAALAAARQRAEALGVQVDLPASFGSPEPEAIHASSRSAARRRMRDLADRHARAAASEAPPADANDLLAGIAAEPSLAVVSEPPTAVATEPSVALTTEAPIAVATEPSMPQAPEPAGSVSIAPEPSAPDPTTGTARGAPGPRRFCHMPTLAAYVMHDGNVYACGHPHAHSSMPLGNLHESSFAEVWNSHAAQLLRKSLVVGEPHPVCATCSIMQSPPPTPTPDQPEPANLPGIVENFRELPWARAILSDAAASTNGDSHAAAHAPADRHTRPADPSALTRPADEAFDLTLAAHAEQLERERTGMLQHLATIEKEHLSLAAHAAELERERPGLLRHLTTIEAQNHSLRAHAKTLAQDLAASKRHIANLDRILEKIHGRRLYAVLSGVKDLFVRKGS